MKYDVLSDPLVHVEVDGELRHADLPQIFALLCGDHELTFTALQRHQHHPWHAFLVQLAAIAVTRGNGPKALDEAPARDPEVWRQSLLRLTKKKREPWCLVVDDLGAPALLQPPVPERNLDGFKTELATPDALDILLTTRNFDLKSQRMSDSEPEHWLFALVAKQTFEGFSGRLNYGIARMNGGMSNRPCLAIAPSLSWGPRFRRDVRVWVEQRPAIAKEHGYDAKGHALLWLDPWDGSESLARSSLDPFFIEICRRIRLTDAEGRLAARMSTSQIARIDATDHAGHTGDIWTPVSTKKGALASLTVPATGFTYRRLAELLFGEWTKPPALEVRADDGREPMVIAQALVRGQGKTEGYHERIVPIPPKARGFFVKDESRRLGSRSVLWIDRAGKVRSGVLKFAVLTLLQGVREKNLDLRDARADPWLERFEARVDEHFFTTLFDTIDLDDATSRGRWDAILDEVAKQTFTEAAEEVPLPSVHRYPILAAAEGRFHGALRRVLAELYEGRAIAKPATMTTEEHDRAHP
ncbi:MAG: hypothetical protein R3B09_15440 [Nannocystaceae bacterium]